MTPADHLPLHEVTFCVLDLETTGTDPCWDDITEIGAILVRGGERLGTFHTLVGPGQVDAFLPSLLEFVGGAVVTGHNIGFDVRFLNAALARQERPLLDPDAVVDTMWLARALLRDEAGDCRLGTLAARFEFDHRPCHRAFEDAAATVDLLHLLIERAWSFGATALDDLRLLPSLAGHTWAAKLRRTASLPRSAGVFACRDADDRVVWVSVADELRRDVRAMFTRTGTSMHASVLRDTERWEVLEIASPFGRAVARERLLHQHRPRLQRKHTVGDHAAYVDVRTTATGWRARAVRVPTTGAVTLGPVPTRAEATAAAAALDRLAARGTSIDDLLGSIELGRVPSALLDDETGNGTCDDPVARAIARRDLDALTRLVQMHTSLALARRAALHDEPGMPAPPAPLPHAHEPVPLDLLSELLLTIEHCGPGTSSDHEPARDIGTPDGEGGLVSGDGAEPDGHGVEAEHEVAAPPRQRLVGRQLEIVETAQQLLEQHA